MNELEKQMKALANRRRLVILKYLKKKKQTSVGDIAAEIRLSFKSTSRHLSVLYAVGIVEREQKSLLVFYTLAKQLHKATQELLKHI